MTKYVVEVLQLKTGKLPESETVAICDSYEEAQIVSVNKLDQINSNKVVRIGEITDVDLIDKADWSSYHRIEIITEYTEE